MFFSYRSFDRWPGQIQGRPRAGRAPRHDLFRAEPGQQQGNVVEAKGLRPAVLTQKRSYY